MWRNFKFPHNCHTWKAEIFHHDNFFSKNIIRDISDKYQVSYAKPNTSVNIAHMGSERSRGGGRGGQWFIRWVDAELDLFWESGQNSLFNLSKHTEFYTISMSIS